ncbi:MAG: hypothetical protein WDN31_01160 [Hyphomicrobium sp.]
MNCCSCAPLAVETIYAKLEDLERKGLISPYLGLSTRESLMRLTFVGKKRPAPRSANRPSKPAKHKRRASMQFPATKHAPLKLAAWWSLGVSWR